MKTEIIGMTYENGKRIVTQRATYDKSDDLFALATLQHRYERICQQIQASTNDAEIQSLTAEKNRLEAEIDEKESYIDGYDAEN